MKFTHFLQLGVIASRFQLGVARYRMCASHTHRCLRAVSMSVCTQWRQSHISLFDVSVLGAPNAAR